MDQKRFSEFFGAMTSWKLKQKDICEILGVHRTTLTRMKEKREFSSGSLPSYIADIIIYINSSLHYYFSYDDQKVIQWMNQFHRYDEFYGQPIVLIKSLSGLMRIKGFLNRFEKNYEYFQTPEDEENKYKINCLLYLSNHKTQDNESTLVDTLNDSENISQEFISICNDLGMKQSDIASLLGIHRSSLKRINDLLLKKNKHREISIVFINLYLKLKKYTRPDWLYESVVVDEFSGIPIKHLQHLNGLILVNSYLHRLKHGYDYYYSVKEFKVKNDNYNPMHIHSFNGKNSLINNLFQLDVLVFKQIITEVMSPFNKIPEKLFKSVLDTLYEKMVSGEYMSVPEELYRLEVNEIWPINLIFQIIKQNNLVVSATTDYFTISSSIIINSEIQDGFFALNCKQVYTLAKSLPALNSQKILFRSYKDNIILISNNNLSIKVEHKSEIPPREIFFKPEGELLLKSKVLLELLDSVDSFSSQQGVRHYLNGVRYEIADNKMTCIATDGHRMACSSESVEYSSNKSLSGIISNESILVLKEYLSNKLEEYVEFVDYEDRFSIRYKQTVLTVKLIEHKYVEWKTMINQQFKYTMTISKIKLLNILNIWHLSNSNDEVYTDFITFNIENNYLILKKRNIIEYKTKVDANKDFMFSLRTSYLKKVVEKVQNVFVVLQKNSYHDAITIIDGNRIYLVMPMRV